MDGMTINHFWWVLTTAHMMPYSEYDAKLMQNNEPRDQNSVQCPENGRSLLTVVFMSKLLLKFSASGWSTEVQKNCSPPMSAAPVKVAIYAWIVCRYAAMSLCRYAIDCSLRCLQSQLHAFLPLWWPYQLLETEIKISQMLLDTWSTMEQCESICGVLCSIKLKHLLQLVFLCLLCFFGCKFCSWGLLRTMQWLWVVLLSASSFSPSWGTEKSCSGETSDLPKKTQPFFDLV